MIPVNHGMKRCNGPSHDGGEYLPETPEFWHFHLSGPYRGQPISRCKNCANWGRVKRGGPHGLVPTKLIVAHLTELIERCGSEEKVQRAYRINRSLIRNIYTGQPTVQKHTAQRILTALATQRKLDRKHGLSERFHTALRKRGVHTRLIDMNENAEWQLSL